MAKIEFGFDLPLEGDRHHLKKPNLLAEQDQLLPTVLRYFNSLWSYDHFYGFAYHAAPYLESWTTLTWLASEYPNIQIGSIVLGVGYRNPALLAKMAATLQLLSGGRLVLGLGAGWREAEYHGYGYPFPKAAKRVNALEEAIQVIRKMWTEEDPQFAGTEYSINHAYCFPHPNPAPPIMIGGEGEQLMLPLIARQADWWNLGGGADTQTARRKRDLLFRFAEQAGRDPSTIRLTAERSGLAWPDTPEDIAKWRAMIEPLVELGFTYFMVGGGIPKSIEQIERFGEDLVFPLKNL